MSPLWLRLQAEVEGPLALLRVATSVNAELPDEPTPDVAGGGASRAAVLDSGCHQLGV